MIMVPMKKENLSATASGNMTGASKNGKRNGQEYLYYRMVPNIQAANGRTRNERPWQFLMGRWPPVYWKLQKWYDQRAGNANARWLNMTVMDGLGIKNGQGIFISNGDKYVD